MDNCSGVVPSANTLPHGVHAITLIAIAIANFFIGTTLSLLNFDEPFITIAVDVLPCLMTIKHNSCLKSYRTRFSATALLFRPSSAAVLSPAKHHLPAEFVSPRQPLTLSHGLVLHEERGYSACSHARPRTGWREKG
jgi:hypothetical protein